MVETEIGVMQRQCLDRRIGDRDELASELRAWQDRRNTERATINWLFNVDTAREKLGGRYPKHGIGHVASSGFSTRPLLYERAQTHHHLDSKP